MKKIDPDKEMRQFQLRCPFGQDTAKLCTPSRFNDCRQCEFVSTDATPKPVRKENMRQKALYYVGQMAEMAARDVRNDPRFMLECAKIADELLKRGDKCREPSNAKSAD